MLRSILFLSMLALVAFPAFAADSTNAPYGADFGYVMEDGHSGAVGYGIAVDLPAVKGTRSVIDGERISFLYTDKGSNYHDDGYIIRTFAFRDLPIWSSLSGAIGAGTWMEIGDGEDQIYSAYLFDLGWSTTRFRAFAGLEHADVRGGPNKTYVRAGIDLRL